MEGISEETFQGIVHSSAQHVSIVGKEPLVDRSSVLMTERLVEECTRGGKTVSLITNGLGLHRLSSEAVRRLEWIDVSLDGGPATYHLYRRGNFDRVIQNVRSALQRGARSINALHTVSSFNLANIDDMMAARPLANWDKIIFSPYAEVRNNGFNPTSTVEFSAFLEALGCSKGFRSDANAFVLIGRGEAHPVYPDPITSAIESANLIDKVLRIESDPLLLGYVRVTYDGYLLTPYQSLNPADYREYAIDLARYASVDVAFEHLRAA
jgi:hypothetical protein